MRVINMTAEELNGFISVLALESLAKWFPPTTNIFLATSAPPTEESEGWIPVENSAELIEKANRRSHIDSDGSVWLNWAEFGGATPYCWIRY